MGHHVLLDLNPRVDPPGWLGGQDKPIYGAMTEALSSSHGAGLRIQSLVFDRETFPTMGSVRAWVIEHEFYDDKIHGTDHSWRVRQHDPMNFQSDSYRTITLTDGVQAIVARPTVISFPAEGTP
jgi:hypothetical protein